MMDSLPRKMCSRACTYTHTPHTDIHTRTIHRPCPRLESPGHGASRLRTQVRASVLAKSTQYLVNPWVWLESWRTGILCGWLRLWVLDVWICARILEGETFPFQSCTWKQCGWDFSVSEPTGGWAGHFPGLVYPRVYPKLGAVVCSLFLSSTHCVEC